MMLMLSCWKHTNLAMDAKFVYCFQAASAGPKKSLHPAPLPPGICPRGLPADVKPAPPRPGLKISRVKQGMFILCM